MPSTKQLISLFALSSTLLAQQPDPLPPDISLPTTSSFTPVDSPLPAPPLAPRPKSTLAAVGLSALLPGLGHTYLGDYRTGSILMTTTGAALGATYAFTRTPGVTLLSTYALTTSFSYGLYAAYRDVRLYNGLSHYSYEMPLDSFADLLLAPFSLSLLQQPAVWGGFLGQLATGLTISYLSSYLFRSIPSDFSHSLYNTLSPLAAFPIGLSEESLFRGYLQSQIAELSTPWTGITLSSLSFGAAHLINTIGMSRSSRLSYYYCSLPFLTASGFYYGWLTHQTRSLQGAVAIHTWYDFTLFSLIALARSYTLPFEKILPRPSFALAIPL
jgi:membrane protease YdiL (CAAX protease family)